MGHGVGDEVLRDVTNVTVYCKCLLFLDISTMMWGLVRHRQSHCCGASCKTSSRSPTSCPHCPYTSLHMEKSDIIRWNDRPLIVCLRANAQQEGRMLNPGEFPEMPSVSSQLL